ncbi:hypothetical protein L1987_17380 [Smallanthus sonchifolius]|uniref:Uncharacterized protein n=1 Tax=Smallanthus sonchifolius TaxID=185202 RepID=A0ACB9IYA5_9ASTR|nr:hypothetical protein L1987_17380 [Smallanthus sonchifolius]
MDEETGRLKNMYREKAGVCEIVAAVSWFLGIVSVTGERTELGFSPAAAPALSNDGARLAETRIFSGANAVASLNIRY